MNTKHNLDIRAMEGKTFIIGRAGHIYIDSPSVSKHHAEIRLIGRKIYLRDLKSTNGTYLIKNKGLVHFEEGFVNPLQPVLMGDKVCLVIDLLATASKFCATDDAITEIQFSRTARSKRA